MAIPAALAAQLSELTFALLRRDDLSSAPGQVAETASLAVPGAVGASLTVWRDGAPLTLAATDEVVEKVDGAQYAALSGPCLDATRERKRFVVDDTSTDLRWPAYARVAERQGIRSSVSLPLLVGGRIAGSLNIYGEAPFSAEALDVADLIAAVGGSVTAVTDELSHARERVENLLHALTSRATIDRAIGITMVRENLSQDAAFSFLSERSQRTNQKLRDIAAELLEQFADNGGVDR